MPSSTTPDYYAILQVDPRAEHEVIQAAFRGLAKKYHPDVYTGTDRNERMRAVNEAYEVLGDPTKRAAYDRQRKPQAEQASASSAQTATAGKTQQQGHTTEHGSTAHQPREEPRPTGANAQRPSQPFSPASEPKRYSASASPFFTPFAPPPPPPQAPPVVYPPGGAPALTFRPRLFPLLGGLLALVAFFLPWLAIQQTGLFLNVSSHTYSGADLAGELVGWLYVEPIAALALVGLGVFATSLSQRFQRWTPAAAAIGLTTVVLFMSQSSSLLGVGTLSNTLGMGCWLAGGGFLFSLIEVLRALATSRSAR
jgi:curved DNA-binding protein CbpA